MKTAICISGIGRSIEHTFANIRKNLIDTFDDPTVFVYIGKGTKSSRVFDLFKDLENVHIRLMDESDITSDGIRYLPGWLENHVHPDGSSPNANSWTRATLARHVVSNMVSEYEVLTGTQFDFPR